MKNLILLLILLGTFSLLAADTFKGKVEYADCGEIDPWYIGDACLVYIKTENGRRIALVMDFEMAVNEFDTDDLVGQTVTVDPTKLEKIKNKNKLMALMEYKDGYFYYEANIGVFEVEHRKKSEMHIMLRGMWSYPKISERPLGYTLKPVNVKTFKTNLVFAKFIKKLIEDKMHRYANYVMHSDEYDHLSYNERIQEINNVHENFGKYLIEFTEIYRVYRDGKFIGY